MALLFTQKGSGQSGQAGEQSFGEHRIVLFVASSEGQIREARLRFGWGEMGYLTPSPAFRRS